jgi:uncharacterized protein YbjT (DUF2867 family)
MPQNKIIAVVGATGAQGGGLVRAILEDEEGVFAVRAITRDAGSERARALAELGAEVVEADVNDKSSLVRAFTGAHGAFCVTFFWEHFSADQEMAHARNMAEAAKEAGVEHVIWSTLEDTRKWVPPDDDRMPTLQERFKVPHFDAKGAADAYFREVDVPTTNLLTSFYWDNFIYFGAGPQRGEDGVLTLSLPMGDRRLPGISSEDIGRAAHGIFKRGREYIGKTVGIAGEHLTGQEMAEAMTKALGEPVRYNPMPFDVYRSLGFPGADDMGNMFQFNHDFAEDFCRARPLDQSRDLNPKLRSFESWLEANKDRIPLDPA